MEKIEEIKKLLKDENETVDFAKNSRTGNVTNLLLKIIDIVESKS